MSLAREGVAVTIVARTPETLEAAGEEIHAQAGYITGQNLLMDGGAYPGTF